MSNGAIVEAMNSHQFQDRFLMDHTIVNNGHSVLCGVTHSTFLAFLSVSKNVPVVSHGRLFILILHGP